MDSSDLDRSWTEVELGALSETFEGEDDGEALTALDEERSRARTRDRLRALERPALQRRGKATSEEDATLSESSERSSSTRGLCGLQGFKLASFASFTAFLDARGLRSVIGESSCAESLDKPFDSDCCSGFLTGRSAHERHARL